MVIRVGGVEIEEVIDWKLSCLKSADCESQSCGLKLAGDISAKDKIVSRNWGSNCSV